jgi:hypothetical protein
MDAKDLIRAEKEYDVETANHYCVDVGGNVAYEVEQFPEFGALQAVALHSKMWPQFAEVRISFIGGTESERRLVRNVVNQNYVPLMNLRIRFVHSGGDVRVAFAKDQGSWSALGTDALLVNPRMPTMNLGWLDAPPDDPPAAAWDVGTGQPPCCYGVIKHEFGHSLGAFLHEHQNPIAPFEWDKKNVYRDLKGPPNNWDEEQVELNMFKRYAEEEIRGTEYDRESIMHYFFPAKWTKSRIRMRANQNLSAQDKFFLQLTYPQMTNLPIELRDTSAPPQQLYAKVQHNDDVKKSGSECPSDRHLVWIALFAVVVMSVLSYLLGHNTRRSK